MEKISEKLILLLLFISFLSCEKTSQKTGTLMDFVPEKASVILKISNWEDLQTDIENNSLLSEFDKKLSNLFISEDAPILKYLHPNSQSLLCFNAINDSLSAYTFIARHSAKLFPTDSIQDKIIETLTIEEQTFQRITIDKKIAYSALVDSVFVASSSQEILMNILKGKTERGETFKKVFELPTASDFTALLRENKLSTTDSSTVDFTSWTALDISLSPESFNATGITLATDSIPQLLSVFEEQVPQQNDLASIVPSDAIGAMSFTFDDAEKFQSQLQKFRGENEPTKTTGIFGSANEVGNIRLKNGNAVFVKSIDASLTSDALARFVSAQSTFREIEIKSFSEPKLFQKTFSPLINYDKANYVFQMENFFVFTENESSAQDIISAFQNNSTLKNTSYFENTTADLSSASSFLLFKMKGDFADSFSKFFNLKSQKSFKNISLENFPLAAFQLSYDKNFAHVTVSCREGKIGVKSLSSHVSEKFNTSLENNILGIPQIIGDNGNVIVQDVGNVLHYISESGKVLWTKNLGSPILGKIEEVEVAGKGIIQMAFTTKNAIYVLDKNGKDVNSFPIKFKDAITQPLSVFDYDKDHNYRFVVVQGKAVLLYDKQGKQVRGFNFSKAKSNIAQPPVHIRMGKKDFIVIAEESGVLNILNRIGKPRVSVSKTFSFSEIPVSLEDDTFVVITKGNTKERISEDGKVSSQNLNVQGSYWFTISGITKATLDNNLLRIDGKLVELPIGLYSKPQFFNVNRKTYVTITETQENKVYVFDKSGNPISGFPVYGTSEASMGDNSSKDGVSLAVKGDGKGIIVYSFN